MPVYPAIAKSQRISGQVLVEITVGADGSVEDVVVVQSPSPLLNQAAIDAAKRMKFDPALSDGAPIRSKIKKGFNFKLN
jgi:TonB family protein